MTAIIAPVENPISRRSLLVPGLSGIPETMLWTLHNRAREAMRANARLSDPDAIRVYASIDYDYERNFGRPDGSHALRSLLFDEAVRHWLRRYPEGTVVELGCGLDRHEIAPRLRRWAPDVDRIDSQPYGPTRGTLGAMFRWLTPLPLFGARVGHVVRVAKAEDADSVVGRPSSAIDRA